MMEADLWARTAPQIERLARVAWPNECCGWVTVGRVIGAANHAATPRTAYALGTLDALAFWQALATDTDPPRALFHSHPLGLAALSELDLQAALAPQGAAWRTLEHWVIAGGPTQWRWACYYWRANALVLRNTL